MTVGSFSNQPRLRVSFPSNPSATDVVPEPPAEAPVAETTPTTAPSFAAAPAAPVSLLLGVQAAAQGTSVGIEARPPTPPPVHAVPTIFNDELCKRQVLIALSLRIVSLENELGFLRDIVRQRFGASMLNRNNHVSETRGGL